MLQGDQLVLREWRESDLEAIAVLRNNVELQALLMSQAKPNSIERVRRWLIERSSRDDMVFFVAAARADDTVLGYLQVANIDSFHGVGEIGICFSPAAHGNHSALEACQLLDSYLHRTLGVRKLTLKVLADNARAIAFYRKSGYREVGTMTQHFRVGDQHQSVLIMERFLGE
ncbi:GNAT family N-acetyltransferase [Dyella tabacisoli]|uniref:N-acetyltransferase n=1 Tax=Dyella tabacisoli TaxID=2282381 RepID=A0A369US86_9GAMM|nr:GNAT family protein [Dyella tabacisoli]RDD82490.1 N-acetyltransferase [Dyella tabacisoli]